MSELLWTTAYAVCVTCRHWWIAVLPVGTPLSILECSKCGDQNSVAKYL